MQNQESAVKMWPAESEEFLRIAEKAFFTLEKVKRSGAAVDDRLTDSLARYLASRYPAGDGPRQRKPFSLRRNSVSKPDRLSAPGTVAERNAKSAGLRIVWRADNRGRSAAGDDRQLVAERRIFARNGQEITARDEVRQGESYLIRLTIIGNAQHVAIVDLLPAGLEIEDYSRLKPSVAPDFSTGLAVRRVDIHDDRLVVFASVNNDGEFEYPVRAKANGPLFRPDFAASGKDDTCTRSVSGKGRLRVASAREAANKQ
ncbi:MAG: hypothetical protein LIP23_00600 [Planctomycetes bacterium]|nr:hypothetical protein [Planctomycetota bacterium]